MKIIDVKTTQSGCARTPNNKDGLSFKSLGSAVLTGACSAMQGIENSGYVVSFLIQDGFGMTLPRVGTGFCLDKDITGEYNIKEGLEVLGREGTTGPLMMSVAPLMILLFGKFCKSTNTNTRLIKTMGENFKKMLAEGKISNAIKNDKDKFLREFNNYSIAKFYKETVPNDKNSKKTIKYLQEEFEKYVTSDKKGAKEAKENIIKIIDDKKVSTSTKLDGFGTLNIETTSGKKTYTTSDVLRAIKDFGYDSITNNKDFVKINENIIENITNNLASKRLLFNISCVAATLGGLSVLPKLYMRSDVAPGAQRFKEAQITQQKPDIQKDENNAKVNFKGRGINNKGFFASLGKLLTKKVPEWFQKEFEYKGYNFTPSLMACLSVFGLLPTRGKRAYDRALVDENGKKDMTEIKEIALRDTASSLGIVYTVPILTKLIVNFYEKNQGFVLTNRASKDKTPWKKFIDVINPYSRLNVLSNAELKALYNNIDTKEKMANFCEYISEKGGDLSKILKKSKNANAVFNEKTFTLDSLKGMSLKEKNQKITDFFKHFGSNAKKLTKGTDIKSQDELIKKLMHDTKDISKSSITTYARGLNSIPAIIATFIISPVILGVLIPMLTYRNTRKEHEKMLQEKAELELQTMQA